jgi:hypothetical protein
MPSTDLPAPPPFAGRELLLRVIGRLRSDVPSLSSFVTLSPVPGFSRWLRSRWDLRQQSAPSARSAQEETRQEEQDLPRHREEQNEEQSQGSEARQEQELLDRLECALSSSALSFVQLFDAALLRATVDGVHDDARPGVPASQATFRPSPSPSTSAYAKPSGRPSSRNASLGPAAAAPAAELRAVLTALLARYLLLVRGQARDPVAGFHLRNGARLARIHWAANCTEYGLAQSSGMMVSYEYVPEQLDTNRAQYIATGRVLAHADVVRLCEWPANAAAAALNSQL